MSTAAEIRNRINSINETKKVTDAMYMISSVKMRRARRELENTAPYIRALRQELGELLHYLPANDSHYFRLPSDEHPFARAVLLITSDKGLNWIQSLPEGIPTPGGDGSTWTRKNGQIVIEKNGKTYRYGDATLPAPAYYWQGDDDGDGDITVNMGDIEALGQGPMSADAAVKYAIDNGYTITVENGQYRIKKPSIKSGPYTPSINRFQG